MSIHSRKTTVLAILAVAAAWSAQSPACAADMIGSSYQAPRHVTVYRERHPRVIRTTYVTRTALDCQTLRVDDPYRSKLVDVCFPPLNLSPKM